MVDRLNGKEIDRKQISWETAAVYLQKYAWKNSCLSSKADMVQTNQRYGTNAKCSRQSGGAD